MAHEVINIPLDEEQIKKKAVKPTVIERIKTIFKPKPTPDLDAQILKTISFWYFFWTGFAIFRGKSIPKEWMKIATNLSKGKIAKKVAEMQEAREVKKPTYRVVDMETRRTIYDEKPVAAN